MLGPFRHAYASRNGRWQRELPAPAVAQTLHRETVTTKRARLSRFLVGPQFHEFDLFASKIFSPSTEHELVFRAQFLDIFATPQLGPPGAILAAGQQTSVKFSSR